jgi:CTP synthase (UTP-ammonia lyase)
VTDGILILFDRHVARSYADATMEALGHAVNRFGVDLPLRELPTASIDASVVGHPGAGVVVGPGSPYDNPDGVLAVIRSARKRGVPLVGT